MLGAQAGRSRPLYAFWHSPAGEEDQHGPAARGAALQRAAAFLGQFGVGREKGRPAASSAPFSLNTFDTVMIRCTSTLFSFSSSESRCECVLSPRRRARVHRWHSSTVHHRMSLVRGVVRRVVVELREARGASRGARRAACIPEERPPGNSTS